MKEFLKKITDHIEDFRPIPFWSWNGCLDPEELKRQIHWMHENGIGGFFMHARGGLQTEYLSEEWMKCIDVCCKEANKLGMDAWIYDENGWPSGFAGGKLLEDPANRDQYIMHSFGPIDKDADVSYRLDREHLLRVDNLQDETSGDYLNLYIKVSASTADILNPQVVNKFIVETHDKYQTHFGETFSQNVKGFFTDEPQYYRWDTPYTPMIAKWFREEYDEDILDQLGLLFVEKEGYRQFRYRYWCGMQKLMLNSFAKQIYEWCEQNGTKLTGHYIEETMLGYQMMCCGGVMPFYEYMHIPGIDWIQPDTGNELPPRQVSSVAQQLGKEQVLTETFAACGWDATPGELRRIAGFQYVNGVNMICQHLIPYSESGQRKYDHPLHFSPINPWVKEYFEEFNDYFSNLGCVLARGKEPINVAILHPSRSAYFDYKRYESGFCIQELEKNIRKVCRTLSSQGIAYHFLDETILEQHGFVEQDRIGCGKCDYKYLVLPTLTTMGKCTERLVREFVENGGRVLLLGKAPEYLEGLPHEYDYLQSNCTLEEIASMQPFQVDDMDTDLYYTYRILEGKPLMFVQNSSDTQQFTQTFRFQDGERSFLAVNPVNGEVTQMPLTVTLRENESLLLFPVREDAPDLEKKQEVELRFSNAEVTFEQNYLTVDAVQYSKNGTEYSEPILIHELFQKLLQERYDGRLWLRYEFEIQTLVEDISLIVEESHTKNCFVNGRQQFFNNRWEDEHDFCVADITPFVYLGTNQIEVVLDWHQSEETYYALFGENVTESLKNCIVYDTEIAAIYLSGKFGVYSKVEMETCDAGMVCASDFYIGETPKQVTELVTDGFPFFRGTLTLKQEVVFDEKEVILKLPGHYLAAKAIINGQAVGKLFFNREIDISKYTRKGINTVEVSFMIGNRNLLGPFHWGGAEDFVGPHMFENCTLPKGKGEKYRYKLRQFY